MAVENEPGAGGDGLCCVESFNCLFLLRRDVMLERYMP